MNNTTSFSIAGLSALVTVFALYFVGVLVGADFQIPATGEPIPPVAFAALTILSGFGSFFVAKWLKKTASPSRNVWIAVIVVFAFFLIPLPAVADPVAAALLLAMHFAVAIPMTLAMQRLVRS